MKKTTAPPRVVSNGAVTWSGRAYPVEGDRSPMYEVLLDTARAFDSASANVARVAGYVQADAQRAIDQVMAENNVHEVSHQSPSDLVKYIAVRDTLAQMLTMITWAINQDDIVPHPPVDPTAPYGIERVTLQPTAGE